MAQITHGDWEVESLDGVDENRGVIYFTATEQGPMERQIYRVALDGSGFARVSRDAGWHFADFSPDASAFIDTHSSVMKPPEQELAGGDGKQIAVIHESSREVENYGLSPVEFLKVKASDGTPLNASMIKPPNFDSNKKYPVIVYTYGGPSQVVRNMWMGGTFLFNQFMAQKGFVIFSVDNRGSMGRGHVFRGDAIPQRRRAGACGPARRSGIPANIAVCRRRADWHLGLELWRAHDTARAFRSAAGFQSGICGRARFGLAPVRLDCHRAISRIAER